jgi:hypothetical protein
MSRKARILSDSKSLKEGMSPVNSVSWQVNGWRGGKEPEPLTILQNIQAAEEFILYCSRFEGVGLRGEEADI